MKLRVKMTIALAMALLMSPILAMPASATSTLDQSTAGDPMAGGMWFGITDGSQFERQSFTAGISGPLEKVTMKLSKWGAPTSVTVDVQAADSAGNPTGPILASKVLPGTALSGSPGSNVDVIFVYPPTVTAGSRYVVTLSSCVGCGGGGDLAWFASMGNPYAGGLAYDWYSGSMPDYDFELATYVGLDSEESSDSSSSEQDAVQLPADQLQQVGVPTSGLCADVKDIALNWSGVSSGSWTPSWAQWANDGNGGPVCTRTLVYAANRQWSVA